MGPKNLHYTPELLKSFGYPVELHEVTTEDGYILTLHRIPHGRKEDPVKPGSVRPVVLMPHCYLSSSWSWIVLGPGKALALLLADNGFDVWMLNARGSVPSTRHTTLSTKSRKFWKFSWHEQGVYDLPASIDYVLAETRQHQLDITAYSMGAAQYFILMSQRPQYSNKIRKVIALAPSAFNEFSASTSSQMSVLDAFLNNFSRLLNIKHFPPACLNLSSIFSSLCTPGSLLYNYACPMMLNLISGSNTTNADMDKVPFYLQHAFDTSSLQTYQHYCQIRKSGTFRPYDYGEEKNYQIYKCSLPPSYDLSKAVNPIYVFWAEEDTITDKRDVSRCCNLLPNVQLSRKIPISSFSHRDFVWGESAAEYIYSEVLQILLS